MVSYAYTVNEFANLIVLCHPDASRILLDSNHKAYAPGNTTRRDFGDQNLMAAACLLRDTQPQYAAVDRRSCGSEYVTIDSSIKNKNAVICPRCQEDRRNMYEYPK
jgi:hypothetical protein